MRQQNKMPLFSTGMWSIPSEGHGLCLRRSFVQLEDSFPALAGHMVKSIAAPRKERLFPVQQNSLGTSFPCVASLRLLAYREVFHSCVYDFGAAQLHAGFYFFHHTSPYLKLPCLFFTGCLYWKTAASSLKAAILPYLHCFQCPAQG